VEGWSRRRLKVYLERWLSVCLKLECLSCSAATTDDAKQVMYDSNTVTYVRHASHKFSSCFKQLD
jgi:hypothetical protein